MFSTWLDKSSLVGGTFEHFTIYKAYLNMSSLVLFIVYCLSYTTQFIYTASTQPVVICRSVTTNITCNNFPLNTNLANTMAAISAPTFNMLRIIFSDNKVFYSLLWTSYYSLRLTGTTLNFTNLKLKYIFYLGSLGFCSGQIQSRGLQTKFKKYIGTLITVVTTVT